MRCLLFTMVILFNIILSISKATAQQVTFDQWIWAGQTLSDSKESQGQILSSCTALKVRCLPHNLRVLVRSWGREITEKSVVHHWPRNLPRDQGLVLTYRMERLITVREAASLIKRDVNIWGRANRNVIAIEIDYDSPSFKLENYQAWLIQLQSLLPRALPLKITGLLTWFEDNQKAAQTLANQVDEISLMFYRQKQSPITKHLLHAIKGIDNIRYGFLCNDNRWHSLWKEQKENGTLRMAIFIVAECGGRDQSAPS